MVVNDESETIQDGTVGPSETMSRDGRITKESVISFNPARSPFDQEPSRMFEGIFQEATSSKDYAHVRREALDVIEQYGLHQQQEHVFELLDKFEASNSTDQTDMTGKGKGRDEWE